MAIFLPGGSGGGGGGGGLHFRDPVDVFATTTARDAAFATGGTLDGDHEDFVLDRSLAVVVGTLAVPTAYTYTGATGAYDATAWVKRNDAVFFKGDAGDQARFLVSAYVNSAVAPAAAPAGGTFERSTSTLTVPVGYTALPVTPVLTERTYRTQAPVNPATDDDLVALVWGLPAESPEYDAAALAEEAAEEAETARDLAEQYAGQAQDIPAGSPRGALVATTPTLPTAATGSNSVVAFGAAELWTIEADAPDGFAAGPVASNERLYLPDIHPAGTNGIWLVIEVAGVEVAEVFISHGGIQGATGADRRTILPVSVTADALVRVGFWPRSGADSQLYPGHGQLRHAPCRYRREDLYGCGAWGRWWRWRRRRRPGRSRWRRWDGRSRRRGRPRRPRRPRRCGRC